MGFRYAPLNRNQKEIRLLELLPDRGDGKRKLIPGCRVFHTRLSTAPPFAALSYVWGDPDRNRVILVDELPVRVPKNLYDAILALRPSDEPLIIWIDFLCIDQADNEEKSWQVRLMGDIYRQTEQVFAWLGPAENESDSVIDYMNSILALVDVLDTERKPRIRRHVWQNLLSETPESALDRSYVAFTASDGTIKIESRIDMNNLFYLINGSRGQGGPISIAALKSLLTRPWWGRIWVMQEIALSKSAVFVCGTKRISRDGLRAMVNSYQAWYFILKEKSELAESSLTPYQSEAVYELFFLKPVLMLSARNTCEINRLPLATLLRLTCLGSYVSDPGSCSMNSSDPRDKVFGLLGLASDREEFEKLGVFPDYSKSCREVYTLTMVALMQLGHLSHLSCCQMPKAQPDLPSWVPDWSQAMMPMLQDMENNAESVGTCRDSLITVTRRGEGIEGISLQGYVYDEISDVASFPGRASSFEIPADKMAAWPREWLLEFFQLAYHNNREYTDFDSRLQAAARSSIGRSMRNCVPDPSVGSGIIEKDVFLEAVALLREAIDGIENPQIKQEVQQFLSSAPDTSRFKGREMLKMEIIAKSLGRIPFITRKGHLGLAYDYVKKGDAVVLFKESLAPFILRRQNDTQWQFVGEAYVDGIMDGEVAGSVRFEDIYLV
ncbi:unnamed protein product [Clonostachys rosea]|uniref:Heterokaryon incompatibility domain-containing protein n=1 Tax=Bionectria ochroleuca TaxID=29856 RepID=A0ABY6U3D6_BIOOC|nr:unnamed protein product [Clonostachys rosea]